MSTLAIIGSAGRGSDGDKLRTNPAYWRMMSVIAQTVTCVIQPTRLVSGGAAFSDHLAVQLYLAGAVKDLSLHFPCPFRADGKGFVESFDKFCPGRTASYYHRLFSAATGQDSLAQLAEAMTKGAIVKVNPGGFKARNSDVANEAEALLAFTFGEAGQPGLKDGGTANTVAKFLARSSALMEREPMVNAGGEVQYPEPLPAYHFNLTDRVLYRL